MENRAIVILLAFLLIGGFGANVNYSMNLEEKRRDMLAAQEKVKATEESVEGMHRQISAVQKDLDAAQAKFGKFEALVQARIEADKTEAEYPTLVAAYQSAVKKVRETAIGMEVSQLKLPNGPLLATAKVTKATDSEFTFAHAGGVSKIAVKDFPPELQDRFRYDDPLMRIGASVTAAPKPAPATALPAPVPVKSGVDQEKVTLLRRRIDETVTLVAQAGASMKQWNSKVSDIRSKHMRNNIYGNSSSSGVEAQAAQKNADAAQSQVNALNAQLNVLRAQLDAALQGR